MRFAHQQLVLPPAEAAPARQQTAGLADLLLLDQAQAHYLQQALYDKLWQPRVQEDAQRAGQPVPAATAHAR